MIIAARRLQSDEAAPGSRTADVVSFAAFIACHTVHFTCLILLAAATDGRLRGADYGWIPAIGVAIVFYVGCGLALRAKLRASAAWTLKHQRTVELVIVGILWFALFRSYPPRAGRAVSFALLSLYLPVALAIFARAVWKTPLAGADPRALQSV
jgi:hypothetical protein